MSTHPIEQLWREFDLPEWFLGNGGTNTKLYRLYEAIRAQERESKQLGLVGQTHHD